MVKKKALFYFYILFLIILFSFANTSNVSAIGISGIRLVENLDFEPFLERTFNYRLGTNADVAMNYGIYAKGNLSEYFTPSVSSVYLEPATGYDFSVDMKLPENLDPGIHVTLICVAEGGAQGGGNIVIRTEACAVIKIKVLYPGTHLIIRNFDVFVENKKVNFILDVENWGKERIDSAITYIDIYEVNKTEKITSVTSDEVSIESNAGATMKAFLDAETLNFGDYIAKANVVYDSKEEKTEKQFKIGELTVRLVNHTKEFEKDRISPMTVEIESIWNQEIKDIYVEVNISKQGNSVGLIKTPPTSLEPWGKANLTGFFDTNEVPASEYEAKFEIFYVGTKSEAYGKVLVKERPLEFPLISTNTVLLVLILMLLIILILLVLKRKKKNEK